MSRNTTCSECGGTMQEGYILNETPALVSLLYRWTQSSWVEGKPERSFLSGFFGLNVNDEQKHHITAYRCKRCGFVKLYAEPVTKKK